MEIPPTKFATSRGARIAYQDFGQGPHTVVAIPPQAQNVEEAWTWPAVRMMLERFGSFARWINFDKRGTGASDRRSQMPGVDERVEDLRAVMDAAGVERAHLYGASEGGPACVLFAATYPERVEGLILHGTGPHTSPQNLTAAERDHYMERARYMAEVWGTDGSPIAEHFAPSAAHDPEFVEWHRRYERRAADSASLLELLEISLDVDVTEALPLIDTPTLILHRKDDPVIPVEWAEALADGIHGSELIVSEGRDHFAYAGEQSWLDDLERFVTGTVSAPQPRSEMKRVEIRTLGAFSVEVDGTPVSGSDWGSRKARQLCKRLVAARGWPVRRDELFDMLWPDESDLARLGARLSVQLSHVRRVLGGGIVADRSTVALDLDAVTTDVEFVLGGTNPAQEILETYGGEFLPADVYEDWSTSIREQVNTTVLDVALSVATEALSSGDCRRAVDLADRAIEIDPYHEAAHRLAIRASIAIPDRARAHRVHQRWSEAMSELGIDVESFDTVLEQAAINLD